jgi:hypothetical protein
MAKLADKHKRYIVERLACYDTPSVIARAVKEDFQLDVTRQQVHEYHPEHGKPAKWLKKLFDAARKKFDEGVTSEPLTKREVRIRRLAVSVERLERLADQAAEKKNFVLAAALDDRIAARYEQIAKDEGGMFTNRRELTGKGGGSLEVHVTRRVVRVDGSA